MKKVQDHYFQRARQEGYLARSAFKLKEIDQRRHLLRPGLHVLDLGCAPGSWLQVIASAVGAQGVVLGVDVQAVSAPLPAQVRLLQADALQIAPAALLAAGGPFDVVLSDMAPKTTGIPSADAARSTELAGRALWLATQVLKPGGHLLVKVFQGAGLPGLRREFAERFAHVRVEKPKASRSESVEVFLLGEGLRPANPAPAATPLP